MAVSRWFVGTCLALTACAREPGGNVDAQLLADWSGPAMLAGQAEAPCDSVVIGTPVSRCGPARVISPQALSAYASAAAGAAQREARTPQEVQRLARVDLVVGAADVSTVTRVLETLGDAVQSADAPIELLIDHSAVSLHRFALAHESRDLFLGLESAARALERDPRRAEAQYNRALALTWAGMRDVAAQAWRQYAALRDRSPVPTLVDVAAARAPDTLALRGVLRESSREHAWNVVLPRFSRALLSNLPDSIRITRRTLDSLVTLAHRDSLDGDIGALRDALLQAYDAHDTTRLRDLHTGIHRYLWAHSGDGRQNVTAAMTVIDSLRRSATLPPALQRWLEMEHVNQLLITGQSREAAAAFARLAEQSPPTSRIYRRRALSGRAMTFASLGRTAEGVERMRDEERECAAAQLEVCVLSMAALGAMSSNLLGDVRQTDAATARTMASLARAPLSAWRWSSAYLLMDVAMVYGAPRAADAFADEAMAVADSLQRADFSAAVAETKVRRSLERGDTLTARRVLAVYRTRWLPRQSPDDQAWSRVNVLEFEGILQRHARPRASLAMLDTALTLTASDDNDARRTPIRMAHARTQLVVGDTTSALREMDALVQQLRDRGRGSETVFDAARLARVLAQLGAEAARVLRTRGEPVRALRALSGRSFLSDDVRVMPVASRSAAIAVRLLDDSAWVWTSSARGVSLRVVPLPEAAVHAAASLDVGALQRVYAAVLAPADESEALEAVCLDVRGAASALPWAAMRRKDGRYVVETTRLVRTDDAWFGCSVPASAPVPAQVAVVDAAPVSGMRALPASKREVSSLRAVWGASATVADAAQGSAATLRAMSSAPVVHFAGHAVTNHAQPAQSYLLLTADADSMLTGAAIAARRFTRSPLVILGACEAGAGSVGAFGGFDSIAGAFLSAGASAVIGAAWAVDDAPTGQLMVQVHAGLRAGASPAEALRRAQVSAMQSKDPALRTPRVWAAFQLMTDER